jgi:hypothetical protein
VTPRRLQPSWTIGTLVRAHLLVFGSGFVALGVSQLLSERRWKLTASYGLLYQLLSPHQWGMLFLLVGTAKLLASWRYPSFALLGLTIGSALIAAWAVSFALRFATDPTTPPTLAVTWTWLALTHLGVASMLAPRQERPGGG